VLDKTGSLPVSSPVQIIYRIVLHKGPLDRNLNHVIKSVARKH